MWLGKRHRTRRLDSTKEYLFICGFFDRAITLFFTLTRHIDRDKNIMYFFSYCLFSNILSLIARVTNTLFLFFPLTTAHARKHINNTSPFKLSFFFFILLFFLILLHTILRKIFYLIILILRILRKQLNTIIL